jgi:predicted Zn-ribbon and HTH transcriptional regulator
MVTIATFNESAKAKHLKQRLAEVGVDADIHNEAGMQKVMLSDAMANAKVMVHEKDFAKAQKSIVEWEESDPDIRTAVRCPQCQSPRVQYPQLARSFPFVPGLAAILFKLGIFEKEFYCEDCHNTWTKDNRER